MSQWSYITICHLHMFNTLFVTSTSLSCQWAEWLRGTTHHYTMLMCMQLHPACHLTCQWQGWRWAHNNNNKACSYTCITWPDNNTDVCPMYPHFDMTCDGEVAMTATRWLWLNKDGMTKVPQWPWHDEEDMKIKHVWPHWWQGQGEHDNNVCMTTPAPSDVMTTKTRVMTGWCWYMCFVPSNHLWVQQLVWCMHHPVSVPPPGLTA